MAAKQGTLAQLSATVAEETKRTVGAVTSSTKSRWFSNLNTVCTIKSAPPRSPDVLKLLAVKSGWLYKRNEQHNWQARWCCVVPHMFLYYFDTNAMTGGTGANKPLEYPTHAKQEEWNTAVRQGLGRSKGKGRSKFPFVNPGPNSNNNNNQQTEDAPLPSDWEDDTTNTNNNNHSNSIMGVTAAQPAGIIDLECYSCLHRSLENPAVLELAGDHIKNPDLRNFYFCCENEMDQEEWNAALINHRHFSILDEVDAYKQVADGFAQQLQSLHCELDDLKQSYESSQAELYSVRSTSEETRRAVVRTIEECWERRPTANTSLATVTNLQAKRHELQNNGGDSASAMIQIHPNDTNINGVHSSVRMLVDYIHLAEDVIESLQLKLGRLETDVQTTGRSDQAAIDALALRHEQTQLAHAREVAHYQNNVEMAVQNAAKAQKELQDLQKDLSSTKMEVTMLMSQQRNKLAKNQSDKKILRTAVIELRQKLEEANSHNSALSHELEKLKLQYETEQSKADLLTRYVDKMESQVQVQQNMMELMSVQAGGGGSVYGGGGSVANRSHHSNRINNLHHRQQQQQQQRDVLMDAMGDDDDEQGFDDEAYSKPPIAPMSSNASHQRRLNSIMTSNGSEYFSSAISKSSRWKTSGYGNSSSGHHQQQQQQQHHNDADQDNKSHMSELTEDRTQREILKYTSYNDAMTSSSPNKAAARQRKRLQEAQLHHHQLQQQQQQQLMKPTYGPPTVIIGVKKPDLPYSDDEEGDEEIISPPQFQTQQQLQDQSPSSQLETIGGNNNNNAGVVKNTYLRRKQQQQYREPAAVPPRAAGSVSSSEQTVEAGGKQQQLSVAKKSRMDADSGQTTPVRARIMVPTKSTTTVASVSPPPPMTESVSSSRSTTVNSTSTNTIIPKQLPQPPVPGVRHIGNIWKRVEEAVLGPAVADDDDDDENSMSSSEGSHHIQSHPPQETPPSRPPPPLPQASKDTWSSPSQPLSFTLEEEKKSPDGLSLQERSQLQREKQLRFLREQGLIRTVGDLSGGAGADGASSVASSSATPTSKRPFSIKNSMRHST